MKQERKSFGGTLGFVMAAAASAVGLGNIWRFPYLAAKDGGGIFLLVYIILALTFGFTLLTAEISIGRFSKQSPITAYDRVKKGWKPLGLLACIVPFLILPYYVSIGGWVLKYFIAYATGHGAEAAADGYFGGFITSVNEPLIMMALFLAAVVVIVILGVDKGIEKSSKILMPLLLVLITGISIFALTISHTDDASGVTRTGLEGFKVYVIPNFEGMTLKQFATVVMDAMGQMFYSLSVAMGIMITYGSYVNDDADLGKSINQIEIVDSLVAFLAGVMIIPAVFTFMGKEGMSASGPSLMFVSLPKVFSAMGGIGNLIACLFFAMVLFAALTSAVSIMEAVVSSYMDEFHIGRNPATVIETVLGGILAVIVCFGYNKLYFEVKLPNGAVAQILDIMDYVSNNVLMPIVAISTCILIGWIVKPEFVINEVEKNGKKMGRKRLFVVMIKFVAPIMLFLLFLKSLGILTVI